MAVQLSDLLAKGYDEASFLAEFTTPALLVELVDGRPKEDSDPAFGAGTEVLSPAVIQQELARGANFLNTATRIEWLRKSDRNPFANLITVGRAGTNDVVIDHTVVSKVHATLSEIDGQWSVQDGRSRNGTFVNGVRLDPGAKMPLNDGDGLELGGEVSTRFLTAGSLWLFVSNFGR